MATTVELTGRKFGASGYVRTYKVWGATNEDNAKAAVLGAAPALIGFLPITGIEGSELVGFEGVYEATVTYGSGGSEVPPGSSYTGEPVPETGDSEFHFEIGVNPVRVLLPPKGGTIDIWGFGGKNESGVPDIVLIGDSGNLDDPPAGAEVYESYLELAKTYYNASSNITTSYMNDCASVVGTVNDDTFWGFAAGEVLCKGVHGSRRSIHDDWQLDYRFAVRRNQTGLEANGIEYDKKGWQFAWPITKQVKDNSAKAMIKKPKFVGVADVYPESDFTLLGLPD